MNKLINKLSNKHVFLYNKHYFPQIQEIVLSIFHAKCEKNVAKHPTMVLLWQQIVLHEPKFYFLVAWGKSPYFMFKTHFTDSCVCR
jgi:hypothetical protein